LFDGDCVWLLPDKYEIKIEIERVLTEAERRGEVANDDGDDDDSATQPLGDETSTDDDDERDTTVDRDKTVVDPSQFDDLDGDAEQFNCENAFQFVSQERYRRALRKQPWNTAAWLRWFEHHSALDAYNEAAVRAMRVLVLEGVIDCVQRGWYQPPGGVARVSFDRARARAGILRSELFASFQFTEKLATRRFSEPAKIVVREVDCIEGALHLKLDKGCNVCVLNMANATRPGGGYKTGAGAQEENLHRRSNLYQHLDDPNKEFPEKTWSYPIPEFGAIYSPDVAFFRGSEMDGYEFMPNIEYLSVISVAADFKPKLIERELPLVTADNDSKYGVHVELQLMPEFELRMKKRILHMLGLCVARDHDAVVLSAFGCGAFRNPPRHVAQLFRSVIKEYGFHHQFRYIMFAIIDDHNARQAHNPDGNFAPFYEVFYKKPPPTN
jgi:uncharacterized protein (TIGR02452 family)